MFKKLMAVVTALCLLLTTGLCLAETAPVSVTVALDGNPTTGYEWTAQSADEAVATVAGEYTADEAAEGMTGVGGTYNFTVTGVAEGSTVVTFKYARSWEDEALSTLTYEVNVDAGLNVAVTSMKAEADGVTLIQDDNDEAEDDDELPFEVTFDAIPEGYTDTWTAVEGVQYIVFQCEGKPTYIAAACTSDFFAGYTLNTSELTDEELEEMRDILTEGYNTPTVTLTKTAHGTDVLLVEEPDDGADGDYASILTIWQGYLISVDAYGDEELTDEDLDLALTIMSDLWVTAK